MTTVVRAFAVVKYRMTVALTVVTGVAFTYAFVGMILIVAGDEAVTLVLCIGVGVTVFALILFGATMWPGAHIRDIAEMRAGGPGVRWTYTSAEWRAANRLEARRIRWSTFTWPVIGVVVGAAAIGTGRLVPGEPWRELLSWLGGVVIAATLAASALVGALSSPVLSRLRRRGEVYVSPHGIYRRPGGYLPFCYSFGHSLADAELSDGPPMHLRLLAVSTNGSRSGEQLWATVLVPAGREVEARQLVELIRADLAERRSRPPHEYRASGSSNWPDIDLSWLT